MKIESLEVTEVQVFPVREDPFMGHIKALAEIVLNDQLIIRGLRVMNGENGIYLAFPTDPFYKGDDFRLVCAPVTRQLREHIEGCVLEAYQASIGNG